MPDDSHPHNDNSHGHDQHDGNNDSPGQGQGQHDPQQNQNQNQNQGRDPSAGPQVFSTTDPVVMNPQPPGGRLAPGATMITETSTTQPPPMAPQSYGQPGGGGGARVVEPQSRGKDQGKDKDKGQDKDKDRGGQGNASKSNPKPRNSDHDDQDNPDDKSHSNAAKPSLTRSLIVAGVVAAVFGFGGGMLGTSLFGGKADDQADAKKKDGGDSKKKSASKKKEGGGDSQQGSMSDSGDENPGYTASDDPETLKKQIGHLSERMDLMSKRLDSMTRPADETPPVFHTLQNKVSELAKEIDNVANLPAQIRTYDNRISDLQEEIKTLREQFSSRDMSSVTHSATNIANRAIGAQPTPPPVSDVSGDVVPTPPGVGNGAGTNAMGGPDATMDLATGLFDQGRYAPSLEIFRRLQRYQPLDARIWYYSALANGLSTNSWDGETRTLVEKGIERERAGTPSASQINSAFANLTVARGKDWLAGYRRRVNAN